MRLVVTSKFARDGVVAWGAAGAARAEGGIERSEERAERGYASRDDSKILVEDRGYHDANDAVCGFCQKG